MEKNSKYLSYKNKKSRKQFVLLKNKLFSMKNLKNKKLRISHHQVVHNLAKEFKSEGVHSLKIK